MDTALMKLKFKFKFLRLFNFFQLFCDIDALADEAREGFFFATLAIPK